MNEKKTIESVKQIKDIFDKHGIHYWIHVGTLLGAVRNGKIIPWDKDFDLATWDTETKKIISLFNEISDKQFEIYFNSSMSHLILLKEECKIDIAIFKLNKPENKVELSYPTPRNPLGSALDYLIWMIKLKNFRVKESKIPSIINYMISRMIKLLPKNFKEKFVFTLKIIYNNFLSLKVNVSLPSYFFENLKDMDFYGMKFKSPRETEDYLSYRYGKDWRIPKKSWKTSRDDNAVCVVKNYK